MGKIRPCICSGPLNHVLFHLFVLLFPVRISGIRKEIMFPETRYAGRRFRGGTCFRITMAMSVVLGPSIHGPAAVLKPGNNFLVSEFSSSTTFTDKENALKVKIAKPVTAGTYQSVFDFCIGRCRHNSASVVHENAYASNFHHCFSLQLNSSGHVDTNAEARLNGINVVIGSLQKHMNCKGSCFASIGSDQPAEVVDDAPKDLNPGACLYTRTEAMLSCDGSHQHTRRLCPCA
ncbi:hypothetical protein QJS10_CPA16g00136 [Acorus calamus]|uniref:SREBP regulating gene protein n=1 Tax=Acorus calamus TaxID=4465 RepID=A0AAV9D1F9_ACOCL|nr:hypothetical protein QJS10_CPA16g00136 [Acorus calamus]